MKRLLLLAAALYIAWYFLHNAGLGLKTGFTHDDLMNMYRSMETGYSVLLRECLLFWRPSGVYRPFGTLIYKVSLDLFGLDLAPLNVFRYLVLCANLVLIYLLARRLSGSRETGLLAALLFSYHPRFSTLYYNPGTLYDIFSFFFYWAAFVYHTRIRQAGGAPQARQVAGVLLLFILGLNSKEIAVTLPVMLGLYELLYHPPDSATPRGLARWMARGWAAPVLGACAGLGFILGRVVTKDGLVAVGDYKPVYSVPEYLKQTGHYLAELLYKSDTTLPAVATVLFLVVLAVVSLLFRSRALGLSALLFAVGILPVAFILWRGLNAVVIPLGGLAMFAAALLASLRERAAAWLSRRPGDRAAAAASALGATPGKAVLFALTALVMLGVHPNLNSFYYDAWSRVEYQPIATFMRQVRELHPNVTKADSILIVKDPFGEFNWASLFIARLVYREPALRVDRLESMDPKPTAEQVAGYSIRLAWRDGRLTNVEASQVAAR